jgi:threonine synthase
MEQILYYSTNLQAEAVSFRNALLQGQAPDRGLYMPNRIPSFNKNEIQDFKGMPYHEIAFAVAEKFLKNEVPSEDLRRIVKDAYNFDVPLEKVYKRHYLMRLDQGPTASFKDFAARMMGRLMQYFLQKEQKELLILTATSGDTGSAIANAFYGLDNIQVVILFPENEVTDRQRKQMTTLGDNISVIGIDGKFDDCQAMVKSAFADEDLKHLNLSSANSINIGRLLPQSVYYIYAWSQLAEINEETVFAVPSGNFGDLMGGLIAKNLGLPVKKFVICTNANDEVPVYLKTNVYKTIAPSKNCVSSAMNVGHPSNMARIISMYGGIMDEKGVISKEPNLTTLKNDLWGVSITDEETRKTIVDVYKKYNVLLEPHGAVGWAGLQLFIDENNEVDNQPTVTLETAHPAKFPQEIRKLLNFDPELPESLQDLDEKEEKFLTLKNDYKLFKSFLLDQ